MKNIKKYIPLIIVLVIAGLGFAFRENIARAVRGDAYVDNKIFTKQLEKAQKSGKDAFPQLSDKVGKDEAEVILHTSKGDITVKLFPTLAPKASENFLKHAKDKYYDGLTFHRVIKDFMIQSGDPKGDGTGGESIWKKGFAVEPTPFLYNIRGALAMANTGAKNSNGSQFYIVQNKDDQSKQLGNAGYPKPIIDAYKKVVTQLVIPNILSLDKSSKVWMLLIPLLTLKSMTTANQKRM